MNAKLGPNGGKVDIDDPRERIPHVRCVNGDGERCGCGARSSLRLHYGPLQHGVLTDDAFLCNLHATEAIERYMETVDRPRFGEAATEEYR